MVKLVPVWLIPVMLSVPVSVNETPPLVVLVALKLDIVLALPRVVPPTEEVVNRAALMMAAPDSERVLLVEVRVTLPVLLMPLALPRSSVKLLMAMAPLVVT